MQIPQGRQLASQSPPIGGVENQFKFWIPQTALPSLSRNSRVPRFHVLFHTPYTF
jgi:hypothetical protein